PGTPGGWTGLGGPAGAPVPPPRPPRPRRRGPGTGAVGAVVALMLLTVATLLLLERADRFEGPVLLTAAGIGLLVTGLAILLAGLRGRTSGALGVLAVATALVAVPLGLAHGTVDGPWERRGGPAFGDLDVTWTQRQQASGGIEQGMGDVRLDLTELPLDGSTLVVPVDVGAGNVELVVPRGTEVSADVEVGLGNIDWSVGGVEERRDGAGNSLDVRTPGIADGEDAELHLVVHVGMGNVSVEEG
ncbi:LiaF domain-containing protein, partial [Cellulomonas endophytica]|uniref:LiaF domain-containing protein n=1 Tax=Cellulomonas endophytica TaxID=2494735 RepID=UPI001F0BAD3B